MESLQTGSRLHAVAQPILRLQDESIVGYEFLSRTEDPVFREPDDFFRVCMEANNLTRVDRHCFRTCIAASRSLPAAHRRHLNLFPSTMIEVPGQQLIADLPDGATGLYCIEISEQQIIGDPSYLRPVVSAFKEAGVRIAIDDVGFGRSCMESLVLLEPDIVKIDRRCIQGIRRDRTRERSLKRLLRVAHSLDSEAVAEGIESREDLDALKDLGVRFGQGFLWGRPGQLADEGESGEAPRVPPRAAGRVVS